ncbi:uncharacterized protein LOC132283937 [Cornus florida]|uniref:uncharacterized protein LOC132283937 n=1 Tax=Cornus florida TaxID=4283 RepID=UPI0028997764|nr:uncharacterized protein LOC132283937 [Cornus florida]
MNRGRPRNFRGRPNPRGRSSRSGGDSTQRYVPVRRADGSPSDAPPGCKDALSSIGTQTSGQMSISNNSKQFDYASIPDYPCQQDYPLPEIEQDMGMLGLVQNTPEKVNYSSRQMEDISASDSAFKKEFSSLSAQSDPKNKHLNLQRSQKAQTSDVGAGSCSSLSFDCSPSVNSYCTQDELSPLAESGVKDRPSNKGPQCGQTSHAKTAGHGSSESSSEDSKAFLDKVLFDICQVRTGNVVTLKSSLFVKNREKRNVVKRSLEGENIIVLRSGMVLLKSYLSHSDQVRIVKKCSELGRGPGGFYQPGYRDGAKLQLKMMCLGKIWDPETSMYVNERPIDGAKPPGIPNEFNQFVEEAIKDSHAILGKKLKRQKVEDILPSMSPNICIVNFYRQSGRLGLHQDKDESPESLHKGLPVVSFSIGDSAEFLYGDQRDIDSAAKVILESGDVLIFGGKSRHIFHGVSAILPDTAPKVLLEETKFIPGRLNLTFREY